MNEAGDYLMPLAEGAIQARAHSRGDRRALIGTEEGRRSPEELTVFKSLGLAVEDLAAAEHVLRRAEAEEPATKVEF